MKHFMKIFLSIALVMGILAACGGGGSGGKQVTVGAKNFTEQYLLSEMTVMLLEQEGFDVELSSDMGSATLREAMTSGQVDMVWDYTGTLLVTYMDEDPIADPQEAFETAKELDKERNGIDWMNKSEVNNTYCLIMQQSQAEELGIQTLEDLAAYVNENPGELTFATDAEFANREDGLPGVEETYGFEFGAEQITEMQIGLQYEALNDDQVDVAMGFATDSRIAEYDLVVLEDTQQFFPAYHAAVGVNEDVFEEYPEIEEITKPLAEQLDSDIMRQLNYQVDVEGKNVGTVAQEWLTENGLLEE